MKSRSQKSNNRQWLHRVLRDARVRAGLSQLQVAKEVGYSNGQFISNIERGLCPVPLPLLKKMATLYGLSARTVADAYARDEKSRIYAFFELV